MYVRYVMLLLCDVIVMLCMYVSTYMCMLPSFLFSNRSATVEQGRLVSNRQRREVTRREENRREEKRREEERRGE